MVVQLPIGEGEKFRGVVDLLSGKAYEYAADGKGKFKEIDVPGRPQGQGREDETGAVRYGRRERRGADGEVPRVRFAHVRGASPGSLARAWRRGGVSRSSACPRRRISASPSCSTGSSSSSPPRRSVRQLADSEVTLVADPSKFPAAKVFKNVSESHVGDMLFLRVYQGTLTAGSDIYKRHGARPSVSGSSSSSGEEPHRAHKLVAGDIGAAVKLKRRTSATRSATSPSPSRSRRRTSRAPRCFRRSPRRPRATRTRSAPGLNRLHEEDPTFDVKVDTEIKQTLISGQGELHLEVLVDRLKKRYGVRGRALQAADPVQRDDHQDRAGAGQAQEADGRPRAVRRRVAQGRAAPARGGFEFVDEIVGGVVPDKFIPAVEKGVVAAMEEGVLAGYPVVDVKVALYDGSYHTVDSSELAFKIAG